jgi:5-(carboxyamino)imidazole ribonucleotide mutase
VPVGEHANARALRRVPERAVGRSAREAAYAGAEMIFFDAMLLTRRGVRGRPVGPAVVELSSVGAGREQEGGDREREAPSGRESNLGGAPGISLVPEPLAEAEVQVELAELDVDNPLVGILMGSKSDMEAMEQAARELQERGIMHEVRVMSAHREPDLVAEYAKNARMRGLRVIIAGAGIAAALPGAVAAHTDLPVIGVPLSGRLTAAGGLDAILSIVQMPPGVPVACVGLDNARNAAILAAQILGC